MLKINTGIRWD